MPVQRRVRTTGAVGEGSVARPKKTRLLLFGILLPPALFLLWYLVSIAPYNRADDALQNVVVYPGATDTAIANLLYGRGLLNSRSAYRLYLRLHGLRGRMQAGTYAISPAMGVSEITRKFSAGDVTSSMLTILPAQRLSDLRAQLISAGFAGIEVDAALDPKQYSGHPALADKPSGANLEGYLHPESFHVTASTPLTAIIESSLDLTAALFTEEVRRGLAAQGLSLHQGVILASIIEREVDDPLVKPSVAQVFLRRLRMGMELGSDVTAYYGASLQGLREAVSVDTPYNTRMYKGWPPGPISNISATSLQAVAEPAATDYLYFVTGDDGVTYFSRSEAEHEALKVLHCKVLCQLD